ncbi:MAG TPA: hypothetical protein PKB02_14245 [Anaerohalosphaeraceae bacterium]|nr:hypothetical protein [Anaerohalosphaeraceae bacterium]
MRKLYKYYILLMAIALVLPVSYLLYRNIFYAGSFDKKHDVQRSPQIKYVEQVDLEGTWDIRGLSYRAITFTKKQGDCYAASYIAGSCLDEWEADRTAVYEGDTIILNRPVLDNFDREYRKLFTIEYMGKPYLLAFSDAEKFETAIKEDETYGWVGILFQRKENLQIK